MKKEMKKKSGVEDFSEFKKVKDERIIDFDSAISMKEDDNNEEDKISDELERQKSDKNLALEISKKQDKKIENIKENV
jgi:hypothetical protein